MNQHISRHRILPLLGTALSLFLLGSTTVNAETEHCDSQACFAEQFKQCQPATFDTPQAMGAQGRYTIQGEQTGGCRVAFVFTQNPNPDWVNQPVSFLLDSSAPLDGQLKAAVAACLMGNGGDRDFACQDEATVTANSKTTAKHAPSTPAPTANGSVTLRIDGDDLEFGWNQDAVVTAADGAYIAITDGMGYMLKADGDQFSVVDTDPGPPQGGGDGIAIQYEDTGTTETVAGITGPVFKVTPSAGGDTADSLLLTLTDDPRVVAINRNMAALFPMLAQILPQLPQAYPGLLNVPDDKGDLQVPIFVAFSDEAPDYFEPVVQAAQAYAAKHAK